MKKISVSCFIRRIAIAWLDKGKSDEEILARAMLRIIKEKAEAQKVNPVAVIDYLQSMKEKLRPAY